MDRLPSLSNLMSPPESKPYDNFDPIYSLKTSPTSFNCDPPSISADRKCMQSELDLPSPPVTPYASNKTLRLPEDAIDGDISCSTSVDPVLFPRTTSSLNADRPLFETESICDTETLADDYLERRSARDSPRAFTSYAISSLSYTPIVSSVYNSNPVEWARMERLHLNKQFSMMTGHNSSVAAASQRGRPDPLRREHNVISRISKPRAKRSSRSTPKTKAPTSFDSPPTMTIKPMRIIGTNRDDTNYTLLPDFCPPIDTLHGNQKGLKADWKGQMLDLSNDPDRAALDPAEITLASTLRLSCATYLCSKRRIFEARLNALCVGKEFRKTDAQQACKIDVNKASKLWTAYEKVGWFRADHFKRFLQ